MAGTRTERLSERNNYIWLLLTLMAMLFLSALGAQLGLEYLGRLTAVSVTAVIVVAVWSLEAHRFPFASRVAVTLLFVLFEGGEYLLEWYHLGTLHIVSILLFTAGTIMIACRQVLLTGAVDSNKIVGSICIYLMMGVAWAVAYLLLERLFPGSIPGLSGENWRHHMQDALYFSYVSLTTLGYGDISPAQPLARYLAYMQAVVVQFYVAIVVASLVGARMASDERDQK